MPVIPTKESAPARKKATDARLAERKAEFLKYYRELPSMRLAAASIGCHEVTVCKWKQVDKTFKEDMRKAKADFAMKKIKSGKVSTEWLLPKLFYREFGEKSKIELDGKLKGNLTVKVVSYTAQNEKQQ